CAREFVPFYYSGGYRGDSLDVW
nr:immunoglobulin heavy chain junction region [Macaca mulatta]